MRIFVANESKQGIGGGWTFLRNFTKYAAKQGVNVQLYGDNPSPGDILFIAGATMATRERVQRAKDAGMKVVLRVDNAPRNSRNRNTGTSRLKDFAQMADMIVYQSTWAKNYIGPWLASSAPQPVIVNGADEEIFNRDGTAQPKEGKPQFLFSQYNRDETKRWHEAWYDFSMASREYKGDAHLWIVGQFSPEQLEYNFDFFMDEKFRYVGVLDNPEDLAEYLRATDVLLIPYYNDACSNTLIEARLCGVETIFHNETGGTPEIMEAPLYKLKASTMVQEYLDAFKSL